MTDIERIRELLDEREYPIAADTPIGRYAQELRNAIGPLLDRYEVMEKALRDIDTFFVFFDSYCPPHLGKDAKIALLNVRAALRGKGE